MKNFLLATVAVVALTLPHHAHAQRIVFDPIQEAQGIQQLAQWVQQIAAMKQEYDQLVRTYNALSHVTDLRSAAAALGGLTRNYFPEASAIPELMRDAANLWGSAGYYNSNDLYYASRIINKWGDRWSEEMERRMAVTSNAKAMAEAAVLNAEDHVLKLDLLRSRLEAAQDVTEVSAVNGLIALENQNMDAHRAQLETVALLLETEQRVTAQRDEQMQRESADLLFLATSPITDSLR